MFSIVNILLLMVILVIGIIFVYKIYYTHKINQKIQSGEITGRKLVDVSKMIMIAVITGLVIYAVQHIFAFCGAGADLSGKEYRLCFRGYPGAVL